MVKTAKIKQVYPRDDMPKRIENVLACSNLLRTVVKADKSTYLIWR